MKATLNIVVLVFLFYNAAYPQFYADSVISDYIIEFWKIADETTAYQDDYRNSKKIFSPKELEHIARLYYKCYDDDPVGFHKYLNEKHEEWERAFLDVVTGKIKLRPWMKVYKLRDYLIYKFGKEFVFVIGTPAFLKGKFIDDETKSRFMPSLNSSLGQTDYIFLIEEISKGIKFFNVGDTLTLSFMHNLDYPNFRFKADTSYLIPVRPWIGSDEYNGESTFQAVNLAPDIASGSQALIFPVENEVINNCEYFGTKDTSWTDFKKYFKETYLIFE